MGHVPCAHVEAASARGVVGSVDVLLVVASSCVESVVTCTGVLHGPL